jgi:hypothetical protein
MYGYPEVTEVVAIISILSDLDHDSPLGPFLGNVVSIYST